jgi:hypothetical protein
MRAMSSTSASARGFPAGSVILTAYPPPDAPDSRVSSTRGKPANRGESTLGATSVDESAAVDLGTGGLELGGIVSLDLDRLRVPVPVAALGAALSAGGVMVSRRELPLPASRDGPGSLPATDAGVPLVDRSGGGISGPSARAGLSMLPGFSATTGPRVTVEASEAVAGVRSAGPGAPGDARCVRLFVRVWPVGDKKNAAVAAAIRSPTSHGASPPERSRLKLRIASSRSSSSSSSWERRVGAGSGIKSETGVRDSFGLGAGTTAKPFARSAWST